MAMTDSVESVNQCPRCHRRLLYEDGEPFCLYCGWRVTRVAPHGFQHRELCPLPKSKEPLEELRSLASLYRLSTRRLYDYVRKGEVLGISYIDGKIVSFSGQSISAIDEIMGPIADEPHRYIAPVGTSGTQVKFMNGIVSAAIYQGRFFPYAKRPSQVELWAQKGYSGVIALVIPDPKA